MKKYIKYPILVGRLRDSIREVTSVNNAQISTLENIILNMGKNIKEVIKLILKSIKGKGEI